MTFKDYNDFVATLPADALLGSLVWFTISAASVPLSGVKADLAARNLSDTHMRTVIRPVDAFKKASKAAETNLGKQEDGLSSSILVRQVGQTEDMSHRHVMLERAHYKAGKRRRLVYEPVGEIVLHRGTKDRKNNTYSGYGIAVKRIDRPDIDFTPEEEAHIEDALGAGAKVKTAFDHHMHYLDSHAVRSYVRDYVVRSLSGILVKESGGVYFVPQGHVDELIRLKEWVASVGSCMDLTPLVGYDETADMLATAVVDDIERDVMELGKEVALILSNPDRSLRTKTYDQFLSRGQEVTNRTREYRDLLNNSLTGLDTVLTMMQDHLIDLSDRVENSPLVTSD